MKVIPAIEFKGFSLSIDGTKILKDITLSLTKNQITAIIGPSGCGKTTLLRSFNRLIELTEGIKINGRVIVDGMDIYRNKKL